MNAVAQRITSGKTVRSNTKGESRKQPRADAKERRTTTTLPKSLPDPSDSIPSNKIEWNAMSMFSTPVVSKSEKDLILVTRPDDGNPSWETIDQFLDKVDTLDLFKAIQRRGGVPAAVADAQFIFLSKSHDYNAADKKDKNLKTNPDEYFPFGMVSYAQMLHVKVQRIVTLTKNLVRKPNNESLRDTALDLINYAAFTADYLKRTQDKQDAEKIAAINVTHPDNPATTPKAG